MRVMTGVPFGACISDARNLKSLYGHEQEQAMKTGNKQRSRRYGSWWMNAILLISLAVIVLVITQPRTARRQEVLPPFVLNPDPEWFKFPVSVSERISRHPSRRDVSDSVDLSSEQSFPASDPPGWIRQRV